MSKVKVYNLKAQEIKEIELNPEIFDVAVKKAVIHQAVVAQQANARLVLAHTKTKGEVRGGGRKPWRQKGTGRARQGSSRSPLWVGGGVTFGPTKDRNFSKKINKKVKKSAIFMALSDKVKDKMFYVVDKFEISEIKTKKITEILKNFDLLGKKILFVIPAKNDNIIKSARNLENVEIIKADSLNIVDLLKYKVLFTDEDSVKRIEEFYKV